MLKYILLLQIYLLYLNNNLLTLNIFLILYFLREYKLEFYFLYLMDHIGISHILMYLNMIRSLIQFLFVKKLILENLNLSFF